MYTVVLKREIGMNVILFVIALMSTHITYALPTKPANIKPLKTTSTSQELSDRRDKIEKAADQNTQDLKTVLEYCTVVDELARMGDPNSAALQKKCKAFLARFNNAMHSYIRK